MDDLIEERLFSSLEGTLAKKCSIHFYHMWDFQSKDHQKDNAQTLKIHT